MRATVKRHAWLGMPILVILLSPQAAQAAVETAFEVAQPISTFEGIRICRVTYVEYTGSPLPGREVPFVVASNRVMDTLARFTNRNVASLLGFKAWADPHHQEGHLFGDTLRVYLDLSSSKPVPEHSAWGKFDAAQATVECVIVAAAASRRGYDAAGLAVDAKYLDLRILGEAAYSKLGGVFLFESLGQLPRKRDFP